MDRFASSTTAALHGLARIMADHLAISLVEEAERRDAAEVAALRRGLAAR